VGVHETHPANKGRGGVGRPLVESVFVWRGGIDMEDEGGKGNNLPVNVTKSIEVLAIGQGRDCCGVTQKTVPAYSSVVWIKENNGNQKIRFSVSAGRTASRKKGLGPHPIAHDASVRESTEPEDRPRRGNNQAERAHSGSKTSQSGHKAHSGRLIMEETRKKLLPLWTKEKSPSIAALRPVRKKEESSLW